jgi:hypothetical protein
MVNKKEFIKTKKPILNKLNRFRIFGKVIKYEKSTEMAAIGALDYVMFHNSMGHHHEPNCY